MSTSPITTPSQQFYGCLELVDMTAKMCSWSTLLKLSRVSKGLRRYVFSLIRQRVRKFLSKYIPKDDINRFFQILHETRSVVAGALVRSIMSIDDAGLLYRHHPLQLNVVVPFLQDFDPSEGGTLGYLQWKQFFLAQGYHNECGGGEGLAPFHLTASATMWTLLKNNDYPNVKISLLQSKTSSSLVPILQSCHTSNFFAMSSTRFYNMYPRLFAAKVNVNMKEHMPSLRCAFDSYNLGLTTFRDSDDWDVFPRGICGEACPLKWRRLRGLRGVSVARWGGILGAHDDGNIVSFEDMTGSGNVMWRIHGECNNVRCSYKFSCNNLARAVL